MTIANTRHADQPGRLYNRAPNAFFTHQNRRPLQQVPSYHDLDDIPTMAAHPENKACGGVTDRVSPQTVTDVKTFDTASYEQDIGGVSIDLCLSETDDEDYFLLQQQEEEEVQETPQHKAFSRPSRTFLPPILEERRVSFKAQHVVMKIETDDCSFDQRYVHQVLDSVQVWFIPHHTTYSKTERSFMWYSKSELACMRQRANEAKKSKRRSSREFIAQRELAQCSLFPPVKSNGYPTKTFGQKTERSSSERRVRYEAMIDAVLIEQYEQRAMCLRLYGRVEPGFSGILDIERLAKIYTIVGKTHNAMERALEKAQTAIAEMNMDEEDDDELSTSTNASGRKRALKPPKMKRSTSFNASALKVETTQCLDQGIGSVFQALISPLIEIRKGDLFLEVGEELSIEI